MCSYGSLLLSLGRPCVFAGWSVSFSEHVFAARLGFSLNVDVFGLMVDIFTTSSLSTV